MSREPLSDFAACLHLRVGGLCTLEMNLRL